MSCDEHRIIPTRAPLITGFMTPILMYTARCAYNGILMFPHARRVEYVIIMVRRIASFLDNGAVMRSIVYLSRRLAWRMVGLTGGVVARAAMQCIQCGAWHERFRYVRFSNMVNVRGVNTICKRTVCLSTTVDTARGTTACVYPPPCASPRIRGLLKRWSARVANLAK